MAAAVEGSSAQVPGPSAWLYWEGRDGRGLQRLMEALESITMATQGGWSQTQTLEDASRAAVCAHVL